MNNLPTTFFRGSASSRTLQRSAMTWAQISTAPYLTSSNPSRRRWSRGFHSRYRSKAANEKIDARNKINYFDQLEVLFFVGVVDQATASLRIYSAECLPMMFANYGRPLSLSLRLVDTLHRYQSPETYVELHGGRSRKLLLGCRTGSKKTRAQLLSRMYPEHVGKPWRDLAQRREVAGSLSEGHAEHRVEARRGDTFTSGLTTLSRLLVGQGSAKHFRDNAFRRVAEAFVNFSWILENNPAKFGLERVQGLREVFR